MPGYVYKCTECKEYAKFQLPISTDPDRQMTCPECGGPMNRSVTIAQFPTTVGKVFAADWFKKQYGHELGERDKQYADEQKKIDREAADFLAKENIKMNLQSRQIKGPE